MSSRSTAVAEGIRDTLQVHLAEFLGAEAAQETNYFLQTGRAVMRGSMCPAICIDDQGNSLDWESIGGKDDNGKPQGVAQYTYRFELEVWLTGTGAEAMRERYNTWRDGITATLQTYWDLYEGAVQIRVTAGDPEFNTGIDSASLWVGKVNVDATVMSVQGTVGVVNDGSAGA